MRFWTLSKDYILILLKIQRAPSLLTCNFSTNCYYEKDIKPINNRDVFIFAIFKFCLSIFAHTLTGKERMLQSILFSCGSHTTVPTVTLNSGESANAGTGMKIWTSLAVERFLKLVLAYIIDENLQPELLCLKR